MNWRVVSEVRVERQRVMSGRVRQGRTSPYWYVLGLGSARCVEGRRRMGGMSFSQDNFSRPQKLRVFIHFCDAFFAFSLLLCCAAVLPPNINIFSLSLSLPRLSPFRALNPHRFSSPLPPIHPIPPQLIVAAACSTFFTDQSRRYGTLSPLHSSSHPLLFAFRLLSLCVDRSPSHSALCI